MSAVLLELRSRMMDAIANGPLHWSDEDTVTEAAAELNRLAQVYAEAGLTTDVELTPEVTAALFAATERVLERQSQEADRKGESE